MNQFSSLLNKKIELQPKKSSENQIFCSACDGIGWLWSESFNDIEKCNRCNKGLIPICNYCKEPLKFISSKICNCEGYKKAKALELKKKDEEESKTLFNQAKHKVKLSEASPSKTEMLYSEVYKYNNGFFYNIEELKEYCLENKIDMPKYVWGTNCIELSINAESIVEDACSELHEDAYSSIDDLDRLQEFLDEWCSKQKYTKTCDADYHYAILLEE